MSSFSTPTNEEVEQALRSIPTLQLRRVFYAGNKNPNWAKPLTQAGAFVPPPEPTVDEKGLIREVYWPEIDYLKEMAVYVPSDVVDVLLTLKDSSVSWIRRAVFEIGASIPANEAARLVPMICDWGVDGLGWRTDPVSQAQMACNLLQGNQYKAGMKLARILFEPRKNSGREYPKVISGLDEYWYAEELPKLSKAMGDNGLQDLIRWLIDYEKYNEYFTGDFDITYMSRSFIDRPDEIHKTMEDALISAILEKSTQQVTKRPSATIKILQKYPVIVVRRIALSSITKALNTAIKDSGDTAEIFAAAKAIINDPLSTDYACRLEFAELIECMYSVDPVVMEDLSSIIDAGPFGSKEAFREKLEHDKEKGLSIDEKLKKRTDEWQHSLLAAIGRDILPEQLLEKLDTLDKKLGVIDSPRAPMMSVTTSWVGPTSPVTKEDILAMSPDDIIGHLESWRAGNEWRSPTHEGHARELTAVISTNPMIIAGQMGLIKRLRPTYLRALIQGWEAAVKVDIEPDWRQVLETVGDALKAEGDSPFESEGDNFDDDRDYKQAKTAAVGLLEEMSKKQKGLTIPSEILSKMADIILEIDTDEPWQDYTKETEDSSTDPLNISINWQWPNYIRTLIMLLTHGSDAPWYSAVLSRLDKELARSDSKGASRAVIGERLGNLSYYAPEWLKDHLEELVGNSSGMSQSQEIVMTTALATSGYYNDAFDLLRNSLSAAVKNLDGLKTGWKGRYEANELVGQWIIHAFIWGHVDYDDELVQEFFRIAPAELRGRAIGNIAWAFMNAEKVSKDIANRFGELWDLRVEHVRQHPEDKEEIADFYWFVKSGKYPTEWWLPRLIEAAELHGNLSTHGMVGEILADASVKYPRESLDALKLLLNDDSDPDMLKYDLKEHAAPKVIASALLSKDADLVNDGNGLMNALGSRGYLDLEDRVNKIIAESEETDSPPNP